MHYSNTLYEASKQACKQVNRQWIITGADREKRENVLGYKECYDTEAEKLVTCNITHI